MAGFQLLRQKKNVSLLDRKQNRKQKQKQTSIHCSDPAANRFLFCFLVNLAELRLNAAVARCRHHSLGQRSDELQPSPPPPSSLSSTAPSAHLGLGNKSL